MSARAGLVMGLVCLSFSGCLERDSQSVSPCTQANVAREIAVTNVDRVDLLFLVDNSGSMAQEQESLRRELPAMIRILTSGDFDQDGRLDGPDDFEPVKNLNVSIVSSDMGTAGYAVPTCDNGDLGDDFGDDGVFRTAGNTAVTGCLGAYGPVFNFQPEMGGSPEDFAFDVGCVASLGTGGCGFEQQLESILKALTPRTALEDITAPTFVPVGSARAASGLERPFYMETQPHGDVENAGFMRDRAVLAIIPVTDEEDCSAHDEQIFNPSGGPFAGTDLNLRCYNEDFEQAALHPVSRYVEGYLQLRPTPASIIYAPITGIPLDLVPAPNARIDWNAILDDERMQYRVDPSNPNRVLPSCNVPLVGEAFPPRRIVRLARDLEARGAHVTAQSICQTSYAGALREIIRQISSALSTTCLPRPLNREADGSVRCDVVATMPEPGDATAACAEIGATPRVNVSGEPVLDGDRPVCVIPQIVPANRSPGAAPPDGTGWYYDDFTEALAMTCSGSDPRIAFAGREPPTGATVRLECFVPVRGGGDAEVELGTFCDPAAPDGEVNPCFEGRSSGGTPLSCDPVERVCGVGCRSHADCTAAGLQGFVCDERPLSAIDETEFSGRSEPHLFCVNPTCG